MQTDNKIQTGTDRTTIPQTLLDRIEQEWQQMRLQAASAPKRPNSQDIAN